MCIVCFLTPDGKYVFSTYNAADEAEAIREANNASEQGVSCYYLVPTGIADAPYRRVDVDA